MQKYEVIWYDGESVQTDIVHAGSHVYESDQIIFWDGQRYARDTHVAIYFKPLRVRRLDLDDSLGVQSDVDS